MVKQGNILAETDCAWQDPWGSIVFTHQGLWVAGGPSRPLQQALPAQSMLLAPSSVT